MSEIGKVIDDSIMRTKITPSHIGSINRPLKCLRCGNEMEVQYSIYVDWDCIGSNLERMKFTVYKTGASKTGHYLFYECVCGYCEWRRRLGDE